MYRVAKLSDPSTTTSAAHEFPRVRPHESLDVGFHAHQGIQRTEPLFRRGLPCPFDIFSAQKAPAV